MPVKGKKKQTQRTVETDKNQILIITLCINELNTSFKRAEIVTLSEKRNTQSYALYKKPALR